MGFVGFILKFLTVKRKVMEVFPAVAARLVEGTRSFPAGLGSLFREPFSGGGRQDFRLKQSSCSVN
jgi:hypothetical protein